MYAPICKFNLISLIIFVFVLLDVKRYYKFNHYDLFDGRLIVGGGRGVTDGVRFVVVHVLDAMSRSDPAGRHANRNANSKVNLQ